MDFTCQSPFAEGYLRVWVIFSLDERVAV